MKSYLSTIFRSLIMILIFILVLPLSLYAEDANSTDKKETYGNSVAFTLSNNLFSDAKFTFGSSFSDKLELLFDIKYHRYDDKPYKYSEFKETGYEFSLVLIPAIDRSKKVNVLVGIGPLIGNESIQSDSTYLHSFEYGMVTERITINNDYIGAKAIIQAEWSLLDNVSIFTNTEIRYSNFESVIERDDLSNSYDSPSKDTIKGSTFDFGEAYVGLKLYF